MFVLMESVAEFSTHGSLGEMDTLIGDESTASYKLLAGRNYPYFGTSSSDNWFRQDFEMYHDYNELFSGFRGRCWRARLCLDLYK